MQFAMCRRSHVTISSRIAFLPVFLLVLLGQMSCTPYEPKFNQAYPAKSEIVQFVVRDNVPAEVKYFYKFDEDVNAKFIWYRFGDSHDSGSIYSGGLAGEDFAELWQYFSAAGTRGTNDVFLKYARDYHGYLIVDVKTIHYVEFYRLDNDNKDLALAIPPELNDILNKVVERVDWLPPAAMDAGAKEDWVRALDSLRALRVLDDTAWPRSREEMMRLHDWTDR
jgi:hypothetical protein